MNIRRRKIEDIKKIQLKLQMAKDTIPETKISLDANKRKLDAAKKKKKASELQTKDIAIKSIQTEAQKRKARKK